MKKFILCIICIMLFSLNSNGQNINTIKQGAVNYIREWCKAPSTFILTDKLGNKILPQVIKYKITKEYERYDTVIKQTTRVIDSVVICKHKLGIDPFKYRAHPDISSNFSVSTNRYRINKRETKRFATHSIWWDDLEEEKSKETIVDSLVFTDNKDYVMRDTLIYAHMSPCTIEYRKHIYNTTYTFYFYYEAQNQMGGLVQDYAIVHYDRKENEYYVTKDNSLRFKTISTGTKEIPLKQEPKVTYTIYNLEY